jgi:hypothetical protein
LSYRVLKFDACLLFWCSAGRSADPGARPSVTLRECGRYANRHGIARADLLPTTKRVAGDVEAQHCPTTPDEHFCNDQITAAPVLGSSSAHGC